MDIRQRLFPLTLMALLLLALPQVVTAAEPEDSGKAARVVIIDDQGAETTIEMDEIQEIVAEALAGLDEALEDLEDFQMEVRLGRDNSLNVSCDDTEFELDLDQVLAQVASAVKAGLGEIHTEDWTDTHHRWANVTDDDLRRELDDLQKEMAELRRDLKKVRRSTGD